MRPQAPRTILGAALVVTVAAAAGAQVERPRAFEVASVRLSDPSTRYSERITATRLDLTKAALRNLLWMAFRIDPVRSAELLVAPGWVKDVAVDVSATFPARATRADVPEMLRALLVERFGLVTHVEPRPKDVYELVVGEGGIRMKEVEAAHELDRVFPANSSVRNLRDDAVTETLNGPVRTMPVPFGTRTITERTMYERTFGRTTRINAVRITMTEFVSILLWSSDRPVVDRTGLTGLYAFAVELPSDPAIAQRLASIGITKTVDGAPLDDPSGVSLFKAVEQLGLKLEPRRVPMDAIVVDRIERVPADN